MSYEKLVSLGAEAVGGIVYLNRVKVGSFESDGFQLTEEGRKAVVEVVGSAKGTIDGKAVQVDVVDIPARTPRKPKGTVPAAEASPAQADDSLAGDLDAVLDAE